MPNTHHSPLLSSLSRLLVLPFVFLLSACPGTPTTPTSPPAAPVIVAALPNAALTPASAATPALVKIGSTSWQKTNPHFASTYTWGWLEDVLVGNPFSFQLRINTDLVGSAFTVLDASGTALAPLPRVLILRIIARPRTASPLPAPSAIGRREIIAISRHPRCRGRQVLTRWRS